MQDEKFGIIFPYKILQFINIKKIKTRPCQIKSSDYLNQTFLPQSLVNDQLRRALWKLASHS